MFTSKTKKVVAECNKTLGPTKSEEFDTGIKMQQIEVTKTENFSQREGYSLCCYKAKIPDKIQKQVSDDILFDYPIDFRNNERSTSNIYTTLENKSLTIRDYETLEEYGIKEVITKSGISLAKVDNTSFSVVAYKQKSPIVKPYSSFPEYIWHLCIHI